MAGVKAGGQPASGSSSCPSGSSSCSTMPGDHLSYQSVRPEIPARCSGGTAFDDAEVKHSEQGEIEDMGEEVMGGASESDGDRDHEVETPEHRGEDHESAVDGCSHDDEATEYPDQIPVQ